MSDRHDQCFGCHQPITTGTVHIHVGLDSFMAKYSPSKQPFGMDDLLAFPFCEDCIEPTEDGWKVHAHVVEGSGDG